MLKPILISSIFRSFNVKRLTPISLFFIFSFGMSQAQIYRVAEMNAVQIRALNKQKTVVILPGGMLEEHGPHLPSFTDGYSNEWLTQKLAEDIASRSGWSVLVFPMIPLGHAGGNEIGGKQVFPGTYSIRRNTLRAIFMDLATELGEQGFRRIFLMHGHGGPYHNLILDQAGDYFRDTYGGTMVNLHGLEPTPVQSSKLKLTGLNLGLTELEKREIGVMDDHAGFDETSRLLFLRPDLIDLGYRSLMPITANDPEQLFKVAGAADWPGYVGSPRLATAAYGAKLQQHRASRNRALAIAILEGMDEREIPRYGKLMVNDKTVSKALRGSSKYDADVERKQLAWIKRNGIH